MAAKIHPTAVIDEGSTIGNETVIWHFSHVMEGAIIGKHCHIGQNVVICSGAVLGDHVRVQNNVSVYSGVYCEDFVFVGPSVVFTNVINPRSAVPRKNEFKPTLVKRGATLGANSTIICGHSIGQFAMIGAGTVVTKDVQDYELVYGNPAVHSGWVSEQGHKLLFDNDSFAKCIESDEWYRLSEGRVIRVS